MRAVNLNTVGSVNAFLLFNVSDIVIANAVVDTPQFWAFAIDEASEVRIEGIVFNRDLFNYAGANNYTIPIGLNSSATPPHDNKSIFLDLLLVNAGTGSTGAPFIAGNPALYLNYLSGARINLTVVNFTNSTGISPITSFAHFGSNVDPSVVLAGSIDGATGALFSGTLPICGINIWDAAAQGWAGVNSIYQMYLAGVPVNGVNGTGAGKVSPTSQCTDVTNNNIYYNTNTAASPTWTQLVIP